MEQDNDYKDTLFEMQKDKTVSMPAINPRPDKQFTIPPQAYLVVPYVRIKGGKEILQNDVETEVSGNSGIIYKRKTIVAVENAQERKEAENFATRVRNFARTRSTFTPLGYVAKLEQRESLYKESQALEKEAAELNSRLKTCKVECYVSLLHFGVEMGVNVARALHDGVRSKLEALKIAVETGTFDGKEAKTVYNDTRSVLQCVTGISYDAVKYALEEAKDAIKENKFPASLPHLENAISLFTPETANVNENETLETL